MLKCDFAFGLAFEYKIFTRALNIFSGLKYHLLEISLGISKT